ncbi:YciI family protein [Kiloniella laminariae]|uniref:YciI family protein n=1 Tax=Kiloniella laminariae TaxID=454162 RepID=A0ABT4LFY9_9PROT|nr:YciI family protein [Kiloniella laminariae]MCZ4279855.1 YciI family protein [Kiloniella laminariae]
MSIIPAGQNIFVIDLEYLVPLEQVEPLIEAHRTFLDKYYASKRFLASGAKVPRSGGVILAVAESRAEVEQLITEDPFHANKIARYSITEFQPRMTAEGLR